MQVQHFLTEAAANLVLGDRARAMQCPEAEVQRINHAPGNLESPAIAGTAKMGS
jgi:hypothetical protein